MSALHLYDRERYVRSYATVERSDSERRAAAEWRWSQASAARRERRGTVVLALAVIAAVTVALTV